MELRFQRQVVRVLDVLERLLNGGLAVIGFDDLGGIPVISVGHQNAEPQLLFNLCKLLLVNREIQPDLFVGGFAQRPLN